MVDPATLVAFVPAAAALVATPGPDTAFVLSRSLGGGRRQGLAAATGVATGVLVHTGAVVVGIAALVRVSPGAFTAVRVVGACYLGYLGVRALVGADDRAAVDPSGGDSYRRGLLVNVTNPKVALFFLAFLPGFAPGGSTTTLATLGGVYALLTVGYLGVVAALSSRVRAVLADDRLARGLELLTAVVLVGFALALLV